MRLLLLAFIVTACTSDEPPPRGNEGVEYPKIQPVWQVTFQDGLLVEEMKGQPRHERDQLQGSLLFQLKPLAGGRMEGHVEAKGPMAFKGDVSGQLQPKEQGLMGQISNPSLMLSFQRGSGQLILEEQVDGGRRRLFAQVKIRQLAKAPSL